MEARSLASLNQIASNPPRYPITPTEKAEPPLLLYISRVPGTRDVILSPFKPQLKNVTVEDVASSLYYIHFDTSKLDPCVSASRAGHDGTGSGNEGSPPQRNIPRKPVPGTSRPPTADGPPTVQLNEPQFTDQQHQLHWRLSQFGDGNDHYRPPLPPRHAQPSAPSPDWHDQDRPPLPPRHGSPLPPRHALQPPRLMEDSGVGLADLYPDPPPYSPHPPTLQQNQVPARKPVGTQAIGDSVSGAGKSLPSPPREEPFTSSARPYSQLGNDGWAERPEYDKPPEQRPWSQQGHSSSTQAYHNKPARTRPYSVDYAARPAAMERFTPSSSPKNVSEPFSLTLIRRDPSSGAQWNVGRISSTHNLASSHDRGAASATHPAVDIQIENSGYAKFRNMPSFRTLYPSVERFAVDPPQQMESGMFSRQLVMSYSKSWSSTLRQKINNLDKKRVAHSRNESSDSVNSSSSVDGEAGPGAAMGQPGPGMKPRGYVFKSPWDGRCEFRTGNAGRSVRCHHLIDNCQGSPYSNSADGLGAPRNDDTSMVSELRFNLPNSEIVGSEGQDAHRQRLGNLRKFWRRDEDGDDDNVDDDHDGEVSPFDVNLGKERAGGGNRGKRAKLGKLIIYNDGFKMLDLLVAANMSVWWHAWERSF